MTLKQRLEAIRKIVKEDKKVVVTQLSEMFDVTEETIRRDLEKLEEEGLVNRTYGGAVLNQDKAHEKIHFLKRAQTNLEEKKIIAEKVAPILATSSSIGADSSSTVLEALKKISDLQGITVLTNSVEALRELSLSSLNVMSTGGVLNKNTLSLQGIVTKELIGRYNVDIALISCKGLILDSGVFDSNESEAELKKMLIERANKVVLLADDSKYDKMAFYKLAGFEKIDTVITNKEPDKEWMKTFKECEIHVIW